MTSWQVYTLMKLDSYSRFLKSPLYRQCMLSEMEGGPLPLEAADNSSLDQNGSDSSRGGSRNFDTDTLQRNVIKYFFNKFIVCRLCCFAARSLFSARLNIYVCIVCECVRVCTCAWVCARAIFAKCVCVTVCAVFAMGCVQTVFVNVNNNFDLLSGPIFPVTNFVGEEIWVKCNHSLYDLLQRRGVLCESYFCFLFRARNLKDQARKEYSVKVSKFKITLEFHHHDDAKL